MARRIEQVEDVAAIFERHHRCDDRNAALALNAHPVGPGLAAIGLGAHLAGQLNRAAKQQQLFGERGLAGVRVRDNGERAASADGIWSEHNNLGCLAGVCPMGGRKANSALHAA